MGPGRATWLTGLWVAVGLGAVVLLVVWALLSRGPPREISFP